MEKRQSEVLGEEFFRKQAESYLSDAMKNRNREFKKVLNPICLSVQLIEKTVSFWTKEFNKEWLKNFKSSKPEHKQKRLDLLESIHSKIEEFEFLEPIFEQSYLCDSIQRPMEIR